MSFEWSAMDRLHEKGPNSDPVRTARSFILNNTGLLQAETC